MPGRLFIVATPIGNLEDLTFRALRVLKECDVIAAEDTRRTSKLLAHYGVSKPMVSLHEHNEYRDAPKLVTRLTRGESIALVSDAGTPGIADPGTTLVRLARQAGISVVPIPGASAITAALSVTGVSAAPFTFLGFPPSSGQARDRWMEQIHRLDHVLVFFEAPHRIRRTLADARAVSGNRPIFTHREISKINEEFVEWPNAGPLSGGVPERGEFVVVIGPKSSRVEGAAAPVMAEHILLSFDQLSAAGFQESDSMVCLTALTGLSSVALSKILKKARILAKRQS
jgi:16S rRNA (cytidine1402-2'-O)-methyltransferase